MSKARTLTFVVFAVTCSALAQHATSVDIVSTYGGWSFGKAEVHIRRSGPSYDGSATLKKNDEPVRELHYAVPTSALDALLTAVSEPSIPEPQMEAFGLTPSVLTARAPEVMKSGIGNWKELSSRQQRFLLANFEDAQRFRQALTDYFNSGEHTDDYPEMECDIKLDDGRSFHLHSRSQKSMMLPWNVAAGSGSIETYNPQLSTALTALLPAGAVNRERLSGSALLAEVAERLSWKLRDGLDRIEVEDKIGAQLDPIKERFDISESGVKCVMSIDESGCGFRATLRTKETKPYLIGLRLPFNDSTAKLVGVEAFLERVPQYESLVTGTEWLKTLAERGTIEIELRYVDGRSLSKQAEERFGQDFAKTKPGLAQSVKAASDTVAFVQVRTTEGNESSRWVLLPQGKAVLWEFKGKHVGMWADTDFPSSDCYAWHCSGAVIAADGTIESR